MSTFVAGDGLALECRAGLDRESLVQTHPRALTRTSKHGDDGVV